MLLGCSQTRIKAPHLSFIITYMCQLFHFFRVSLSVLLEGARWDLGKSWGDTGKRWGLWRKVLCAAEVKQLCDGGGPANVKRCHRHWDLSLGLTECSGWRQRSRGGGLCCPWGDPRSSWFSWPGRRR